MKSRLQEKKTNPRDCIGSTRYNSNLEWADGDCVIAAGPGKLSQSK